MKVSIHRNEMGRPEFGVMGNNAKKVARAYLELVRLLCPPTEIKLKGK